MMDLWIIDLHQGSEGVYKVENASPSKRFNDNNVFYIRDNYHYDYHTLGQTAFASKQEALQAVLDHVAAERERLREVFETLTLEWGKACDDSSAS